LPCQRAMPTTPADRYRCICPVSFPVPCCLPRYPVGSASASLLSRPAPALLSLRPTGLLSRPSAAFVTGLQPARLPAQAACQLLDQTGYYRGGFFLHWQHAPTGRTGQRRALARRAHASADDASRAEARKPTGSLKVVKFTLMGQPFMAISAESLDPFNHAVSFMVQCDDQAEIDRLWAALSQRGKTEQCGWLKDRYGLFW
jgi:hypothetical protein